MRQSNNIVDELQPRFGSSRTMAGGGTLLSRIIVELFFTLQMATSQSLLAMTDGVWGLSGGVDGVE